MQIANDKAVSIHYTLRNNAGEILDSSHDSEALVYLHGYHNIIPGLENALNGRSVGDEFEVSIQPEEAYGLREENHVQVVDKEMFGDIEELHVGMQFHAELSEGMGIVTIAHIDGDQITLDGNHPLAGEVLHFAVEVMSIRDASEEEITHGHIHGSGCHH